MLAPLEVADVFSPEECGSIIAIARKGRCDDAALVRGAISSNIRSAGNFWLDEEGEGDWIFQRMLDVVADANRAHFNFELEEFSEKMQVAFYATAENGFFDWHVDVGDGRLAGRRKLTMVVQLSEDSSYEGGNLETNADGTVRAASRLRGSALLLPSFVPHRVAPVTCGDRYSLTLWSHGPTFR